MKLQQFGFATVGLGVLSLVSSFACRYSLSQDSFWSDEQAEQYVHAAAEYHNLAFSKGEESGEYQRSRDAYESQRDKLDRAIAMRDRIPFLLWLAGFVASGMGIAMLLVHRGRSS